MDFDNVVASLDAQIKHITKKIKGIFGFQIF
ncbi:Uncharacterised protein [Weissella viridescens]|uniref:Uncharacterized protein n=1 Tax=Weissella viridescens TaxID=1629 RepID=A0A380NXU8_WEIVI|nr:Uncharacterised protein [Weissella viridescens]